jgi:hypothetical protein
MTQTVSRSYTILDHEFEADELKDIVTHGMSAGVSGFIYTKDCMTSSMSSKMTSRPISPIGIMTTWVRITTSVLLQALKVVTPILFALSMNSRTVWSGLMLSSCHSRFFLKTVTTSDYVFSYLSRPFRP